VWPPYTLIPYIVNPTPQPELIADLSLQDAERSYPAVRSPVVQDHPRYSFAGNVLLSAQSDPGMELTEMGRDPTLAGCLWRVCNSQRTAQTDFLKKGLSRICLRIVNCIWQLLCTV
jgi:hypothetical protein